MPNKTIYIKDSETEIWERAQRELGGESISSVVTDCLRSRLRMSEVRSNVDALKEALGEVNRERNLDLELHPAWSPVILDPSTLDVGFKIHQRHAFPDRIMSLIVDELNFDRTGRLNSAAIERVKAAIAEFWDGQCVERHVAVRIGIVDIPSRLLNLVGKRGLVKIANHGELDFVILAVHPAAEVPLTGDDQELQNAITRSDFTIQFEDAIVDGSNRRVISGSYISLIRGRY
jgi:hypothetical protein